MNGSKKIRRQTQESLRLDMTSLEKSYEKGKELGCHFSSRLCKENETLNRSYREI